MNQEKRTDNLVDSPAAESSKAAAGAVRKAVLPNGMTVLVKELHTAPVVAVNAWVKVGSVQEGERERGITHFIEHMLFKGTDKIKVGELDQLIKAAGGYNNAHTRYESTDFIDVLPASKLDVALETMADALRHSTFDAEELEREKKVVLEELHRAQDNPSWEAWNKLTHLSFEQSPYRHPIIGYQEVVEAQDRALLVSYWKRYYRPSNMVFVVVGDIDADQVLAKVAKAFEDWKEAAAPLSSPARDAQQTALRSEEFSGEIETTVLMLGVEGPAELDADAPAMEIAIGILGQGISSRLNRRVREEKKLVHEVSAAQFNGKNPGLIYLYAELEPGQVKAAVEALWREVALMKRDLVRPQELEKQHLSMEFQEARERMSMDGLAGKLGYFECLGDYRLADEQMEKMRRVSTEDVRRVMNKYFQPERVNLVLYRPQDSKASGMERQGWQKLLEKAENSAANYGQAAKDQTNEFKAVQPSLASARAGEKPSSGSGFERFTLSNGLKLLVKPVHHTPLVSAFFTFKAGLRLEPEDKAGAFHLMARLALKGTEKRNAEQVAETIDGLGAVLSPYSDQDSFGFSCQALEGKFAQAMGLVAEVIQQPKISPEEFEKEKERVLKDIKDKKDEADEYVEELFRKTLFQRSPYARPWEGLPESVRALQADDLRELQNRFWLPNNLLLSIVGDIEPSQAKDLAERLFGEKVWRQRDLRFPAVAQEERAAQERKIVKKLKKKQAHLMLGWLAPRPQDKDYFAFRLFNSILGEGMNSRLFSEVREKRGLCYTVYSSFDRSLDPGAFFVYVGTQPEREAEALETVMKVVRQAQTEGVSAEELSAAKAYAKGIFEMARQDFSTEARLAAQYEFWGLGMETIQAFPQRIEEVSLDEVRAVARKYADVERAVMAVLRP